MGLIDKLQEDFFNGFEELALDEVKDYLEKNSKVVSLLCNDKKDFKDKFEDILEQLIIEEAMTGCYTKLYRGISPEGLGHPEYFAYALERDIFSSDDLHKINLNNESWKKEFIDKYSKKDLLKNLIDNLLSSVD